MLTNNVKGTHDIIGEEANGFAYIENVLKQICELFAYNSLCSITGGLTSL